MATTLLKLSMTLIVSHWFGIQYPWSIGNGKHFNNSSLRPSIAAHLSNYWQILKHIMVIFMQVNNSPSPEYTSNKLIADGISFIALRLTPVSLTLTLALTHIVCKYNIPLWALPPLAQLEITLQPHLTKCF